jgi:formylglycine-generating enzyme required for sulfatase activity
VESVSWNDVQAFIQRLNSREGIEIYRLPTEAEWEYAARAGNPDDYTGDLDARGWYSSNSGNQPHPVGQKQLNGWGLYDMHGNVWEWVSDWYGPYSQESATDPTGAASGSNRVFRGGSWLNDATDCRSANRATLDPGNRGSGLGFRLVRTAQ